MSPQIGNDLSQNDLHKIIGYKSTPACLALTAHMHGCILLLGGILNEAPPIGQKLKQLLGDMDQILHLIFFHEAFVWTADICDMWSCVVDITWL